MKVLLKKDVDNLGYAGEVYSVSPGYGRNFLIPKGLAVVASDSMLRQASVWRKQAEARREQIKAEYAALSDKISGVTLTFAARAGESGKLYGSITTAQIADDLNEALGTDIDRRKVGVEPLRQLGTHKVPVRLSGEFQPEITVVVEAEAEEDAPPEEVATRVEAEDLIEDDTQTEEE